MWPEAQTVRFFPFLLLLLFVPSVHGAELHGRVAYWNFEEGAGSYAYDQWNTDENNSCLLNNMEAGDWNTTTNATGSTYSLKFTRENPDEHLNCTGVTYPDDADPRTTCLWILKENAGGEEIMPWAWGYSVDSESWGHYSPSGDLSVYWWGYSGGDQDTSYDMKDKKYEFQCFWYNGTTRFFQSNNGTIYTHNKVLDTGRSNMQIGARPYLSVGGYGLRGNIDEMRIYSRVLTHEERYNLQIYNDINGSGGGGGGGVPYAVLVWPPNNGSETKNNNVTLTINVTGADEPFDVNITANGIQVYNAQISNDTSRNVTIGLDLLEKAYNINLSVNDGVTGVRSDSRSLIINRSHAYQPTWPPQNYYYPGFTNDQFNFTVRCNGTNVSLRKVHLIAINDTVSYFQNTSAITINTESNFTFTFPGVSTGDYNFTYLCEYGSGGDGLGTYADYNETRTDNVTVHHHVHFAEITEFSPENGTTLSNTSLNLSIKIIENSSGIQKIHYFINGVYNGTNSSNCDYDGENSTCVLNFTTSEGVFNWIVFAEVGSDNTSLTQNLTFTVDYSDVLIYDERDLTLITTCDFTVNIEDQNNSVIVTGSSSSGSITFRDVESVIGQRITIRVINESCTDYTSPRRVSVSNFSIGDDFVVVMPHENNIPLLVAFELTDFTADWQGAFVRITKYLNGTSDFTIDSGFFDVSNRYSAYLLQQDVYSIRLQKLDGSAEEVFGQYVPLTSEEVELNTQEIITFGNPTTLWNVLTYSVTSNASRYILFSYNATTTVTTSNIVIYNGTIRDSVLENFTSHADNFMLHYLPQNENITYTVCFDIETESYGNVTYCKAIKPNEYYLIPLGDQVSRSWIILIATVLVVFVAGLFGGVDSKTGGLVVAGVVLLFSFIGFLPYTTEQITPGVAAVSGGAFLLSLIVIIAVLNKMLEGKR